ncbi:Glutaredoxin-C9 [Striga hermonthica]|uniref:Glutaredoxin-C9 n=1 Tax=Striga hermonthica TaxID=68872 RepID=A0A9N7RCZ6_STRHE|nr:Glutaredoxin-C9 [Striga hermonthica]
MQQALPSTDGAGEYPPENSVSGNHGGKKVRDLVAENAVVVFAREGCCMCHVVKLLLHGHGVSPAIRLFSEGDEADVKRELSQFLWRSGGGGAPPPQFPAVFVGGELFGGVDQIMGAHISGELVPRLRAARALWL